MCVKPLTPEYDQCVAWLAEYTQAIASGRAPAITWLHRGGCLQSLRDLAGAVRDYSRALACSDELSARELAQVYDSRCVCRRQLDDLAGAIADGEQAVALAPRNARYAADLGFARLRAGDRAGALAELNRALALDPQESWALSYRGMCYQVLGDHEQAVADFTHLLAIDPQVSFYVFVSRARSYMELERFTEAIADCNVAAERAGVALEDYRIYLLRGYCYLRMGEPGAALGDLSRAIALAPGLAELYRWRGLAYQALGDAAAAADDFNQFVARHSSGAVHALQELAEVLAAPSAHAVPDLALAA